MYSFTVHIKEFGEETSRKLLMITTLLNVTGMRRFDLVEQYRHHRERTTSSGE